MKFIVCKTSGKRVNGKGLKYIGERNGRYESVVDINSMDELSSFLETYGKDTETIVYKTEQFGYPSKEELAGLPAYTIELRDYWRE